MVTFFNLLGKPYVGVVAISCNLFLNTYHILERRLADVRPYQGPVLSLTRQHGRISDSVLLSV